MSIAHTMSTPVPSPRWLLLGSLALNLFLVGLATALLMREPPQPERGVAARIERLASALPKADGDKLRDDLAANRTTFDKARARFESERDGISAALRLEPYDSAAVRAAMAKARAARQDLDIGVERIIADAAAKMSPAGRAAMADWRPQRQSNR